MAGKNPKTSVAELLPKSKETKIRFAVAALIVIILVALVGYASYAFGVYQTENSDIVSYTLDNNTPYQFIKPLLTFSISRTYKEAELASLHDNVAKIAANQPAGAVTRYAYYFKDLTTGKWTGINETDQYDPASMLKVAFAVGAYKQEESTPGFLSRQLTYTQDIANIQSQFDLAPPVDLTVGQSYSVPYLLKEMLSDSDNGAKDLLVLSMDPKILTQMFTDLSIQEPTSTSATNTLTISAQEYSRFLRILYYGTYDLSWSDSNNILKLLSESTFTSGLVAGVPSDVVVAHKFGEHAVTSSDSQVTGVELSDCGIVYHPTHPYLICVMTEGKDVDALSKFIAQVSKVTYDDVSAQK
ncbi:MAG: serine hydrolase [Minisyncoccia bacterium]